MKTETKSYVHISRLNKDNEEEHVAQPPKAVEKMATEGKDFKQYSTLNYTESSFENPTEFYEFRMPDGSPIDEDVKTAIINRGWILFQQATAKDLVLEDDAEFVNKGEAPVDISAVALAPKEGGRRKGDPETRARKSLRDLLTSDPDKLAQLIAEFAAQNAGVVG